MNSQKKQGNVFLWLDLVGVLFLAVFAPKYLIVAMASVIAGAVTLIAAMWFFKVVAQLFAPTPNDWVRYQSIRGLGSFFLAVIGIVSCLVSGAFLRQGQLARTIDPSWFLVWMGFFFAYMCGFFYFLDKYQHGYKD